MAISFSAQFPYSQIRDNIDNERNRIALFTRPKNNADTPSKKSNKRKREDDDQILVIQAPSITYIGKTFGPMAHPAENDDSST